jgi:hypothetical protein
MPDLLFNDVCKPSMGPGTSLSWVPTIQNIKVYLHSLIKDNKGLATDTSCPLTVRQDEVALNHLYSSEKKAAVTVMQLKKLNCHGIQRHLQMQFIVSVLSVFLACFTRVLLFIL